VERELWVGEMMLILGGVLSEAPKLGRAAAS
jgi:hypothetical protein